MKLIAVRTPFSLRILAPTIAAFSFITRSVAVDDNYVSANSELKYQKSYSLPCLKAAVRSLAVKVSTRRPAPSFWTRELQKN